MDLDSFLLNSAEVNFLLLAYLSINQIGNKQTELNKKISLYVYIIAAGLINILYPVLILNGVM